MHKGGSGEGTRGRSQKNCRKTYINNTSIKLKIVYLPLDFVQKAVVKQIFGGPPPPGFSTVCICDGIK